MYIPTQTDYATLVSLSNGAGIDPMDVAIVLYEESGFNPASPGPPGANVAGLNQMDTDNLTSLGLTRAEWLQMSATEQLPYIFHFWQGLANRFNNGRFPSDGGELLGLNFLPGAWKTAGAGTNPNAPIAASTGAYAWAYNDNELLQNASGQITVNTLRSYLSRVASKASPRWHMIVNGITQAEDLIPGLNTAIYNKVVPQVIGGLLIGGALYLAYENWPAVTRRLRRA